MTTYLNSAEIDYLEKAGIIVKIDHQWGAGDTYPYPTYRVFLEEKDSTRITTLLEEYRKEREKETYLELTPAEIKIVEKAGFTIKPEKVVDEFDGTRTVVIQVKDKEAIQTLIGKSGNWDWGF